LVLNSGHKVLLLETGSSEGNKIAGTNNLTIATYNLHGINQGRCFLESLCSSSDTVFVQEHWLALFDLHQLYNIHDDTICYTSSAKDAAISRGCFRGRPFGRVAVFVKKALGGVTKLVKAATRYIIIQVGQFVLANVYRGWRGSVTVERWTCDQ